MASVSEEFAKFRELLVAAGNAATSVPLDLRSVLESEYGADNVWDEEELHAEFYIRGFDGAEFSVTRKLVGVEGGLRYVDNLRLYYNFIGSIGV